MAIHYALFTNNPNEEWAEYSAVVQADQTANLDDLARCMVGDESPEEFATVRAVLEQIGPAIERVLLEGRRVDFGGMFEFSPRIHGSFDDVTDEFDSSRHTLDVAARAGHRIQQILRQQAKLEKEIPILPTARPDDVHDHESQTHNQMITPGGVAEVSGSRLRLHPHASDEGVFLIHIANQEEFKVTTIIHQTAARLRILVPPLDPGRYHLEIRGRQGNGTLLRMGRLQDPLTVPG